jgi:hypothetical protein
MMRTDAAFLDWLAWMVRDAIRLLGDDRDALAVS